MAILRTKTINLSHDVNDLKKQDYYQERVKFDDNDVSLDFIYNTLGDLIKNRYPVDATITSSPLFFNSDSWTAALPSSWLTFTENSENAFIEFRVADREDMADASSWTTVSLDGASTEYEIFPSSFDGPYTTSSTDLSVSDDGTKYTFVVSKYATDDFAYFTSEILSSSSKTWQANYISFEINSDRAGEIMEVAVAHGLGFPSYSLSVAPNPYNYLIHLDRINEWQTVYWDISDWPTGERNWDYVKAMAFSPIEAGSDYTVQIRNIQMADINDSAVSTPGSQVLPVDNKRFIQYRIVLSTITDEISPEIESVQFTTTTKSYILPNDMLRLQKHVG